MKPFILSILLGMLMLRGAADSSAMAIATLATSATAVTRATAVTSDTAVTGQTPDGFGGREMLVYVPARLPAPGARALVVVLHGGLGSARNIESGKAERGLSMDAVAEKDGFIVAYLNGTRVSGVFGPDALGWNAGGGCCGLSAERKVDDVGYISGAVGYLRAKYGIDGNRVYGIGHSNGAMMTERMMCETGLYAAAIAISGPLNVDTDVCPGARGKRILDIHGADDANVPIAGGRGS